MAAWLASKAPGPGQTDINDGEVWVYVTALCAAAGDPSDCHPASSVPGPSFKSRAVCAAHLDQDLGRAGNPRLMGGCLRRKEA